MFEDGGADHELLQRPVSLGRTQSHVRVDATRRKILGLNAAKLYGIDVPPEFRLPDDAGTPGAQEDAQLVESA